jgi:hypothetical protein
MRKLCAAIVLLLAAVTCVWADTQDTTVFKAAMSPDNEVPPVSAPGTSGFSTVTVRVTRDLTGNITAATVMFEIDYTVPSATTFTGLHIHNITGGNVGGVVINTGLSANSPVNATGTGRITRIVNYTSTDTAGLSYVTGLLDAPENYYVNIHSTDQATGLMRAPLPKTSLTFRPPMSPSQEAPPLTVDAEGAAVIQVQVNRNDAGVITSGTVTFDVDYRLPANSIISGLHIHNGAAGVSGPVVIGTDINGTTRSITSPTGRGNVFRVVDIDSSNTTGLTALNGLFSDPTQYYVNIHTTTNASGIMRGQLSKDTYAFFGLMTQAEEVPNSGTPATANTMTIAKVTRDGTGNITGGTVSFNVAFSGFGGTVTFTGLHIHNQIFGVNGGVVINTGITGVAQGNSVTDDDGDGSINRDVTIDSLTLGGTSLTALKGLLANPENYYVNIHTTTFGGGIIRAQLAREIYHYVTAMSPAKEVPVVNSTASATGFVTVKIARDPATGAITGGQVTFDVNTVGSGPTTFTGLHIHSGSAAVSGPVVINTGLNATNNVDTQNGTTNITRVVNIGPTDTTQLAMLGTLITNPDQAYINIHTTVNGSGLARSQMLSVVNYVPQVAGGGDWISSITITNPSPTASVHGIVNTFQSSGTAMPAALIDPNISFLIPPGGSTTVNLHNKGNLATGYVRVYSSADVTLKAAYNFPTFPASATVTPVTARSVSIPVTMAPGSFGTGIAFLNVTAGTVILSLRNSFGLPLGSSSFDVTAGQHVVGFIDNFFSGLSTPFSGRLVIENRPATGDGVISAIGLQFDGSSLLPVAITPLP